MRELYLSQSQQQAGVLVQLLTLTASPELPEPPAYLEKPQTRARGLTLTSVTGFNAVTH